MKKLHLLLLLILFLPNLSKALTIPDIGTVVSHWTCDETSGTRYDSNTTNANNLTDNNTVGYATGLLNNACDFELANQEYLSKSTPTAIPLTTANRTVNAWVNFESLGTTDYDTQAIVDYGEETANKEFNFMVRYLSSNRNFLWDKYGAGTVSNTNPTFSTASWYMLTMSYDGTNVKWYQNATLVDTEAPGTINSSAPVFIIGKRGVGTLNQHHFDGLIDEVTLFSETLTDSEITALYNSGTPLPYAGSSTSSTSTTATSTTMEDDNIVFSLALIVFFLASIWIGLVFSAFRKK